MTKLHILSDLHLEGRSFALPNTDADIIVLAGDIGTAKAPAIKQINAWAWNKPVIYVAGNHEFYGGEFPKQLNVLFSSLLPHTYFLENRSVVLCGVRFLGCTLWTDFALYGEPNLAEAEWWLNDYVMIY